MLHEVVLARRWTEHIQYILKRTTSHLISMYIKASRYYYSFSFDWWNHFLFSGMIKNWRFNFHFWTGKLTTNQSLMMITDDPVRCRCQDEDTDTPSSETDLGSWGFFPGQSYLWLSLMVFGWRGRKQNGAVARNWDTGFDRMWKFDYVLADCLDAIIWLEMVSVLYWYSQKCQSCMDDLQQNKTLGRSLSCFQAFLHG